MIYKLYKIFISFCYEDSNIVKLKENITSVGNFVIDLHEYVLLIHQ